MHLPSTISITATCPTTAGLIFLLEIFAGTKNQYFIEFPQTDPIGYTCIPAAYVQSEFQRHQAEAMMDYNGTLESADQFVRLKLRRHNHLVHKPSRSRLIELPPDGRLITHVELKK